MAEITTNKVNAVIEDKEMFRHIETINAARLNLLIASSRAQRDGVALQITESIRLAIEGLDKARAEILESMNWQAE